MKRTTQRRVGRYFVLGEFMDWREGELPPSRADQGLKRLCGLVLDPVRREFGMVTITSGYRTARTNQLVSGAPRSRHRYDVFPAEPGVDFTARTGTPVEWAGFIDRLEVPVGLGLYPGHVHVDLGPERRW